MKITKNDKLRELIDYWLEEESLEEFLERFDLTPYEVISSLYEIGLIGDNDLESMWPS